MSKSGFVVISSQRSGSTQLISLLDQHPDIRCAGELFKNRDAHNIKHPSDSFYYPTKAKSLSYKLAPNLLIKRHLKKCLAKEHSVFGFKLMVSQINSIPQLPSILTELAFTTIVLLRKDIARQSLSLELARANKQWVNHRGTKEKKDKTILDCDALRKTIAYNRKSHDYLKSMAINEDALLLDFDTLITDCDSLLKLVTGHLGLSGDFEYRMKHRRSSSLTYAERIKNIAEVEACLSENGLSL